VLKEFLINIASLRNETYEFQFHIDKTFFENFGKELVEDGNLDVRLTLTKHESFLETTFKIAGSVKLICDRSLDEFDYPLDLSNPVIFKFAEEAEEISEEVIHLRRDADVLNAGQYIYDMIGSALPLKRLHPRFKEDEENEEGKIIYSSSTQKEETIDPRWEKLKKLK
jgi:uncharacterized metal-binding protein YceD (DUF177 family)